MKKMSLIIASLVFAGSVGFAADAEHSTESSTDTSKNPITGTEL